MNTLRSSPVIFISTLVLLSVAIRWYAFQDPIQGSHVWLSTHTVITSQIWTTQGIAKHKFNPVYTFPSAPDRNMRSLASGISDQKGNYYYVSYPPFSFYLAYIFFTLLFLNPSIEGIYVLNIIIHSFTSILLYIVICKAYGKRILHATYTPALLAASLYLFSTQTLWCHIYMYFADSLVQMLWVAIILISFMIFRRGHISNWKTLSIFFIACFLLVYTEWLGLFACLVLFLYAAYQSIKKPVYLRALFVIGTATIGALSLTIFQYSLIDGLDSFVQISLEKYFDRNGYNSDNLYFTKINFLRLTSIYWRNPKANIILLAAFLFIYIISQKKKSHLNSDLFFLFSISFFPILLHHAIFLEFSSRHDFSSLKSSVFFCLFIPILYNSIDFEKDQKINFIDKKKILLPLFVIFLLLNITLFYSIDTTDSLRQKAEVISNTSDRHESLFAITKGDQTNGVMVFMGTERGFSTQIQLLTNRNILAIAERENALQHLRKFDQSEGKIYFFDFYGRMIGIESIKRDDAATNGPN